MAAIAKVRSRFFADAATIAGLVLAFGSILGGLVLEGGKLRDVAQITAALIVVGGTLGAVLVTTPMSTFISAAGKAPLVFCETQRPASDLIDELVTLAAVARRGGITSLESDADKLTDPFLRKALNLAIDGVGVHEIRQMMELQISQEELQLESEAKVYEAAGGYAPTVGIIGAVLGLIQVMKHLENIEDVGRGIAVSFVATVYGVALANLCLLPAAHKLKARASRALQMRELVLEGAIAIAEGLNPQLIRLKLEAYLRKQPAPITAREITRTS
ncbi:MAG: MotA/TolQ/ExbB proton channel [Bryobacterales bacterium]|nr:MotA/TolQ/ExbB proton channel [Bryobacterales bacterium]